MQTATAKTNIYLRSVKRTQKTEHRTQDIVMKKENYLSLALGIVLFVIIGFAYATTFNYTYDTDTPAGSDAPSVLDDKIREVKDAVQERINVDHYFALTGNQVSDANTGEHRKITFYSSISAPAQVNGKAHLYMNSDDLYYQNDVNSPIQITEKGVLNIKSSDITGKLANNTFFTGLNAAGTGTVSLIGVDTNDMAVLADGAETYSDSAPVNSKQIPNKKYVDDAADSISIENDKDCIDNYASKSLDVVYQATESGFVSVYAETTLGSVHYLYLYTDSSNPPTTAVKQIRMDQDNSKIVDFLYPVKKDNYWKVYRDNDGINVVEIKWIPFK